MDESLTSRNRLRMRRARLGWTLEELGDLTGMSESMLSLLERGLRSPSPATKVRLARTLGCRVADIFEPEPLDVEVGA